MEKTKEASKVSYIANFDNICHQNAYVPWLKKYLTCATFKSNFKWNYKF